MKIVLKKTKFIPARNANVSIFSEIIRGYGIFETLRTFGDKEVLHQKQHVKRLLTSAKKIELKIRYDEKTIQRMIERVAKKSPHKNQIIKIIAIPDELFITSAPLKIDKKIYEGVSCKSVSCVRNMPEVKSVSYLASFLSNKRAKEAGYFAAILIGKKGEVYECDYSNIFWFEEDTLCTRKDKILPGIVRAEIIKKSPFKVKYKTVKIDELKKKKEIFLTNSLKGIVPITRIDKKTIGDGTPGKNTKTLIERFSKIFFSAAA